MRVANGACVINRERINPKNGRFMQRAGPARLIVLHPVCSHMFSFIMCGRLALNPRSFAAMHTCYMLNLKNECGYCVLVRIWMWSTRVYICYGYMAIGVVLQGIKKIYIRFTLS